MSDRYWPDLVCEDHVPLGRERSRPQGPAGRKGQVVSVRVGHQDGAIIGIHHLASGDAVAIKAVARLDVDLVALGQLRKVDPVDVVRRDAGQPQDAHGVRAANRVRGPGARQDSAKGAHLKSKTRTGLRLASLEDEVESGSSAYRALGPDAAAVAVDDPSGGGQPDAGPLEVALAVQPLKGPEQPVHIDHVE